MTEPDGGTPANAAERLAAGLDRVSERQVDARMAAAHRLGDAARAAIERLMATTAPPEVLVKAAEDLEALADLLEAYDQTRSYEGLAEAAGAGHEEAFFDWSPLFGLANPLAPPIRARIEDGVVVGVARFGSAYEGPPGCLHGGLVAAAFDDVLGMTQSLSGQIGMTGDLRVRYRRPTPLHVDLRFEGRLVGVEGRKVTTHATLHARGELLAEADGLFISVSQERFAAMAANRVRPPRRRS